MYGNLLRKNNITQILTPPYFFDIDLKKINVKLISNWKLNTFSPFSRIRLPESEYLIKLYTPLGFTKVYEKSGYFCLPYAIDDPLTPPFEIINNNEYYNYQKLIWEIHNEKRARLRGDIQKFIREIYFFLTYKWYFDAIYNEYINRPLLTLAYNVIFPFFR